MKASIRAKIEARQGAPRRRGREPRFVRVNLRELLAVLDALELEAPYALRLSERFRAKLLAEAGAGAERAR